MISSHELIDGSDSLSHFESGINKHESSSFQSSSEEDRTLIHRSRLQSPGL